MAANSNSSNLKKNVHDDEWKDEVVNGGGDLVPELVSEEVGDRRLQHEAERIRRQHGCPEHWPIPFTDQLHYCTTIASQCSQRGRRIV